MLLPGRHIHEEPLRVVLREGPLHVDGQRDRLPIVD